MVYLNYAVKVSHFCIYYFLACRPFTPEEMDILYQHYAKIRHELLKTYNPNEQQPTLEDALYYTIEEIYDEADDRKNYDQQTSNTINKRLGLFGDISTAISLASFLYSQLDVVTALSVVANLEKRAQYDPQFRTSFPGFLRNNAWFL